MKKRKEIKTPKHINDANLKRYYKQVAELERIMDETIRLTWLTKKEIKKKLKVATHSCIRLKYWVFK